MIALANAASFSELIRNKWKNVNCHLDDLNFSLPP